MNVEQSRVKSVFLNLAAFIGVYTIVIANLYVILTGIDILYPDAVTDYYYSFERAASTLRFAASSLIVALPITMVIYRFIRRDQQVLNENHWIIKSLGYLTLIAVTVTIAGRLIFQINQLLEGELLIRSLLKTLAIVVILGVVFFHYWGSIAQKAWYTLNTQRLIRWVTILGSIACLVIGIWAAGTPGIARDMQMDKQKVENLNTIKYSLQQSVFGYDNLPARAMPATLGELFAATSFPYGSFDEADYVYTKVSDTKARVCVNFLRAAKINGSDLKMPMPRGNVTENHPAGLVCYTYTANTTNRTITVAKD